ncbi:MAG: CBS domain-containing protein [Candidatus Bathyarchaeia archaeon]
MLLVRDVMVRDLVTVETTVSVMRAVKLMNDFEVGCLLIVEKGEVVGILTERDILKRVVAEGRKPDETFVSDVMSTPPVVVSPEMKLEDAVEVMFKKKIKKLPVVENGKLVGLVTLTDIARLQPAMMEIIKRLMKTYEVPKSMSKVIKYYVV